MAIFSLSQIYMHNVILLWLGILQKHIHRIEVVVADSAVIFQNIKFR